VGQAGCTISTEAPFYPWPDSGSLFLQNDFSQTDGYGRSLDNRLRFYVSVFLELPNALTNGAVVPFPSGAALALPVLALAVLSTVRVAGPLLAVWAHPALFALAYPSRTDTVAATVQGTHLCTGLQKHIM